tara:strand:- start:480 stop:647 length:168 start_codon:yes stop_codon:yes gene_type:complete
MSNIAVDTPLDEEDAWQEPAQSRDRTSSPLPPGLAVETVVDSSNTHNIMMTFALI